MRRQAPYFFIERGLIHQPPDAVGGGEQADNGGHKGALYEASGVRVCTAELPSHAGRGRVLERIFVLVHFLDRVMHGGRGIHVR